MADESKPKGTRSDFAPPAALRGVIITLAIAITLLIALYLLRRFATAMLLIFAGLLFGLFLDGCARLLGRYLRLRHGFAVGLAVLVVAGAVIGFVVLAGPSVAQQAKVLGAQLPQSVAVTESQLQKYRWGRAIIASLPSAGSLQLSVSGIVSRISVVFSWVMEGVGAMLFIFFVGLYLAATPQQYEHSLLLLLPRERRARGAEVLQAIATALRWWLLGRAVTMTLMGLLTTLALSFAGVPLALVLGIIAALLLFVPYLGAVAAAVPALLVALMQSPAKALWVAVIYTGVHVFEGYCITPFVQRRAVALPPALLLSVQLLSAALFGLAGVIFSTPLTVVAVVLVQALYIQDVLGERIPLLGDHRRKSGA